MTTKSQNQFATKEDLKKLETGIGKNIRGFKNEIKEEMIGFKDEIKTYMGVLYEKFDNEVKVIAEQHVDIDRNLVSINKHLGHVDQRLDKLEIKTDMLIETVADIKVDTAMIREELEGKTDKSEHKKLEHRVVVLESRA